MAASPTTDPVATDAAGAPRGRPMRLIALITASVVLFAGGAAVAVATRPGSTAPVGSATGVPSASAAATDAQRRATGPARVQAAVRPGQGRLLVDWVLDPGGEDVRSIEVSLRRAGEDLPMRVRHAIASTGSVVLTRLDRKQRYVVGVAPVVRSADGEQTTGAAVEVSVRPDGTKAARGALEPSAPKGWTPLLTERFDRDVALGRFARAYPGWAWYDGMTDTSRETARPRSQVGSWNSATTVRVRDGMLDCRLHTKGERPQVCAISPTPTGAPWRGQRYGRYSVRFKADRVPGYKIAWLLWPDSNDWTQGEIDFPEAELDGAITGASHRNDGDPSDFAWFVDTAARTDAWHTATIDWRPGRLTFVLDGESWTTTERAALPRVPMRWTLQAETEIVAKAPSRKAEGHIRIDWVAMWSRSR